MYQQASGAAVKTAQHVQTNLQIPHIRVTVGQVIVVHIRVIAVIVITEAVMSEPLRASTEMGRTARRVQTNRQTHITQAMAVQRTVVHILVTPGIVIMVVHI